MDSDTASFAAWRRSYRRARARRLLLLAIPVLGALGGGILIGSIYRGPGASGDSGSDGALSPELLEYAAAFSKCHEEHFRTEHDKQLWFMVGDLFRDSYSLEQGGGRVDPEPIDYLRATSGVTHLHAPRQWPCQIEWRLTRSEIRPARGFLKVQRDAACDDELVDCVDEEWTRMLGRLPRDAWGDSYVVVHAAIEAWRIDSGQVEAPLPALTVRHLPAPPLNQYYVEAEQRSGDYLFRASIRSTYDAREPWARMMVEFTYEPEMRGSTSGTPVTRK
ncbi:MAG: hypothetical protein AB1716_22605 [Planctomycetota bacterium]